LVLLGLLACEPADDTQPVVVSTHPASGATGVPTNTQIRVAFSESMDAASVEAAFSITPVTAGNLDWARDSMLYW